jgi:hypothetical protein
MKAHDILSEALGLLSGAIVRTRDVDQHIRAIADTAADIRDGIAPQLGIEPHAAGVLAEEMEQQRDSLLSLDCKLAVLRMHLRSLAPALKTGVHLDRLGIPRGAIAVEAQPEAAGRPLPLDMVQHLCYNDAPCPPHVLASR